VKDCIKRDVLTFLSLNQPQDKDGNTPLKLAQNATYPSHNEVAQQIANHIMRKGLHLTNSIHGSNGKYHNVNTSTSQKINNGGRYNSPARNNNYNTTGYIHSSFDELTMDSNLDKSDTANRNHRADPPGMGRGASIRHGHAPAMVSFGDLLEDEEREESANAVGGGDDEQGREVRESIEISLGGGR
jgi:hypothetical protein